MNDEIIVAGSKLEAEQTHETKKKSAMIQKVRENNFYLILHHCGIKNLKIELVDHRASQK